MNTPKHLRPGLTMCLTGALLAVGCASVAFADDTEIFVGQTTTAASPNIMFIMDTSGSMGTNVVTTAPFDPASDYVGRGTGACSGLSGHVFYATGSTVPRCNSNAWFPVANQLCSAATAVLSDGGTGVYGPDNLIRWRGNSGNRRWQSGNFNGSGASDVDCQSDSALSPYPTARSYLTGAEQSSAAGVYTTNANESYWRAANSPSLTSYRLYSANYVVWNEQFRSTTLGTRMSIMQNAATQMLNALTGVNVGLMRYSDNAGGGDGRGGDYLASGGYVVNAVSPIESARASLISTVNGFTANGYTPLSETLFEAYRYYSGGPVLFGNSSSPGRSVAASRNPATATGANYESPADYSCQKNYVVYLTDGLPTADSEANAAIQALPNFNALGGSCLAAGSGPDSGWRDSGLCLGALAQYMFNADLRPGSSDPPGNQNVRSYFIGLGSDFVDSSTNQLNAAFSYLNTAAARGGGQAYQANDLGDLTMVLDDIVSSIVTDAQSFAAPTVGVNAFNRTRNLDELYISLFKPSTDYHWPGNVKKYKLAGGRLVDRNGNAAVDDTTGQFYDSSQELWSTTPDGSAVDRGGMAAMLPAPGSRRLYTYLDANKRPASAVDLTGSAYAIDLANSAVSDAVLGTGGAGLPTRTQLLNWMQGIDVQDEDGDGNTTEARKKTMGDPLHAQPAVVVYGGSAATPDINDSVLYVATNDGYLHAVDVASGRELWAFIPAELIGDQVNLYVDDNTANRHYGLDGDIRVEKFDVNGNGIVDGNDRVLLYFGMGRGGNNYYALDVTNKARPYFVWSLGSADLPGVGQTWSPPVLANVQIANPVSTQNSQRLVLIMGGGYDPAEDGIDIGGTYLTSNTVGNRIYMVDAITGALLWSAGPSGASLNLARMDHSIPAGITVIDLNGDGYADRMYAGDMAGQLWRFDINNGQNTAGLVTGGVIASLGTHDDTTHLVADARRFYAPPDVALVASPGTAPYLNIALGSGYRGHPLNTGIQDRFYGVRDFNINNKLSQAQYNALTVVHDADLTDITTTLTPTIAATSPGWKLRLDQNGGWVGEKVLGSATTLGGRVLFTTYTPASGGSSGANCLPNTGTNRAYAISVTDGSPLIDANNDGTIALSDRSVAVATGSIVGEVTVMFMGDGRIPVLGLPQSCTAGDPNCSCDANGNCTLPPPSCQQGDPNCQCDANGNNCQQINPDTVCTAGVAAIPVCTQTNRLRKTFWMENAAN